MKLPVNDLGSTSRRIIEQADQQNLKTGRDNDIGEGRLILTDTATGNRYSVEVTSGVLGITAL